MKDTWDITDADMARVLTDISQLRLLAPFVSEMTLSDAARKLDIKMTTLLYHVHRWVRLGILEVSREEARKGKAIKYYRVSSGIFYVPFSLTPSENLNRLLSRISNPFHTLFDREMARVLQDMATDWLIKISHVAGEDSQDIRQDIHFTLLRADKRDTSVREVDMNKPALVSSYGVIELDFAVAKELEKEMIALLQRYGKKELKGAQRYAYHLGLTPVTDDSFEPKD